MPPPRFAVLNISYTLTSPGVTTTITTDIPCHLWMRWSNTEPLIHLDPLYKRGIATHAEPRYCFVVYHDNEQEEPGDTLTHTFEKPAWQACEIRYFYFWGTVAGADSPSTSSIFKHRRTDNPITTVFYSTYADGYINSSLPLGFASYLAAHRRTVGAPPFINFAWLVPMQYFAHEDAFPSGAGFHIDRVFVHFDTSLIGGSQALSEGKLSLFERPPRHTHTDASDALIIQNGQPLYPSDPLVASDFNKNKYSGNGGNISYSAWASGVYNDIPLNDSGLSWINKTGITKFCLRTHQDINAISPGRGFPSVEKGFRFSSRNAGLAEAPKLTITYSAPCP